MGRSKRKLKNRRYIDLFAGCGGLALGLHNAGWRGLFAVEKDSMAFETLRHNLIARHEHYAWPSWLPLQNHDIKSVLKKYGAHLAKLKGSVDLVAGGPPCQGFSMDGRRRESDKRNKLIHSYVEFIRIVRPRILLFENVKGFTIPFRRGKQQGTIYSDLVVEKLEALGYDVCGDILDFSDFGVPQRRKRFIIVGVTKHAAGRPRRDQKPAKTFFELLKNNKATFLKSIGLSVKASVRTAISDLEKRHGTTDCPDSKKFKSGLYGKARTPFQLFLRSGGGNSPPNCHRFAKHLKKTVKVFKKLLNNGRRNRKINGSERKKFGLKKRSVTVMSPTAIAPTLTSIPDDYLHYSEPRILTVRENARLQTFPDWFEFKGKYTTGGHLRAKQVPRYTQVGNAIPPIFGEQAGIALKTL
jgi:DNA (cytosine-5)-methyltransferase 1